MKQSASYHPALDGIRAVCVVFTVAAHVKDTPWFINGSVGVDVFFALSGWLITTLLLDEWNEHGRLDLRAFYVRRFFRIIPLYALTISLYGAAAVTLSVVLGNTAEVDNFLSGFVYFSTFNGEYMNHQDGLLFGHSWTLGIEEKFYVLWPLLLPLLILGKRLAIPFLFLSICLLMVPAFAWGLLLRGYAGLGFGAMAAFMAWRSPACRQSLKGSATQPVTLALVLGAYLLSLIQPHPFLWNIAISMSAALFIGSIWLSGGTTRIKAVLEFNPFVRAGRLTYAVYLTHVLVINVVVLILSRFTDDPNWALSFALSYSFSLALGVFLNRLIERPFINFGRKLARGSRDSFPLRDGSKGFMLMMRRKDRQRGARS
ncbi:acyltransferase family protein [Pseudorhizobium flavum]|uniref:Peptidoglycan/LPS O-acetylase OafA/YrhL n=1 Tax=Pseudorhizobium flavum TaxID=1335061 RepID=A0A7W9Z389_9HYPH|nr:acyltransferase [Pseudorhizobium flavum]MBB6182341.1 peptidoglycan/LPS O-acetylase OafA/YrhL [Pseudorhizobium flavum]CAD6632057.1 acyltransferase [Pseudorhizobium flavum]